MTDTIMEAINKKVQTDEVPSDAIMEQLKIYTKAQEVIDSSINSDVPDDYSDHLYPVAFVKTCTQELENINSQLDAYIKSFMAVDFSKVDKNWLRDRTRKFIDWINKKLKSLRTKIVKGIKGMYKQVQKAKQIIEPILSPPSLDTIITWASNVISFFTEPYNKVVQFITDFTTYTPPLTTEASKIVTKVAAAPVLIMAKTDELKGEGAEVVKEEVKNAVKDIKFDPITMNDLKG